jgi:esterase/lipase superfamily enzyme
MMDALIDWFLAHELVLATAIAAFAGAAVAGIAQVFLSRRTAKAEADRQRKATEAIEKGLVVEAGGTRRYEVRSRPIYRFPGRPSPAGPAPDAAEGAPSPPASSPPADDLFGDVAAEDWTALLSKELLLKPTDGEIFVPVFYGTDRAPSGRTEPNARYGRERGELVYGRAMVSIPKDHHMGRMERPSLWRLEFRENPVRHVVLRDLEELGHSEFFSALNEKVARTEYKSAFVFIHGFNVTFAAAARRAAQMAFDLFYVGCEQGEATLCTVPILYSWPSEGETILYTHDANNADASVAHLKSFLLDVAARSGAQSITIIAHSMGTRALANALNEVGLQMREDDKPAIREIILAAPDIDRTVFLNIAAAVKRTADRITLYASSRDKALQISMALNGFPRLGDANGGITTFAGGDSIDASIVGDDILAHSYYGETSVLSDLYSLMLHGFPPAKRFGLLSHGDPPDQHWIMRARAGR